MGTALGSCPSKELVRKQLQELLENARYQEETEREVRNSGKILEFWENPKEFWEFSLLGKGVESLIPVGFGIFGNFGTVGIGIFPMGLGVECGEFWGKSWIKSGMKSWNSVGILVKILEFWGIPGFGFVFWDLCPESPGRDFGKVGGVCEIRRLQEILGIVQHLQGGNWGKMEKLEWEKWE
ncbi:hypothetical protein TURU_151457 [Turdus rufiventris]|nr:hypothetical protein TURU_151457 [Turdus rufiventris]